MRRGKRAGLASVLSIAVLAACSTADDQTPPEPRLPPDPPVARLTPPGSTLTDPCRAAIVYQQELDELRRKFSETHPEVVNQRQRVNRAKAECFAAAGHAPRSGNWIEKDGVRECDGYMTRRADQDYCSAEIPESWVPFTFNGREYYMQPLTGSVGNPQPGH